MLIHFPLFQIDYRLCDIQGNTFVSLGGRPFEDLKPFTGTFFACFFWGGRWEIIWVLNDFTIHS